MAFATSSSAFGIKPVVFGGASSNTVKSPNPLFGSTLPASTGLFGQPAQQQPQQQINLFGQSQQQQPASTGLFGQPAQQQPTSAGLFGQPPQQQPASTGLFGQPPQQQQQQQPSLFGQSQQQQQPASTSLLGQPTSFGLFSQPSSTGIIGQPGPQTSSFFSNPQNNNQSTNQVAQQQPSIFSNASNNNHNSQWGSNVGPAPMQPAGPPIFSKSTKFNDLPDDLKKSFENIDSHIQGRIQISKELRQLKLGEEATKGQELLRGVRKELVTNLSVTRSDVLFTRELKAKADQAVQDTITATRIVDGFRNPQQNGIYLKNHATFPLEFFNRITDQMRERLQWYKSTIEQIERKLSSATNQVQHTPQAISATLQAQHATFIALASKTASIDTELQKLKALYTQLWRAKTGSIRDPFDDLDKQSGGDFGLGKLHVG